MHSEKSATWRYYFSHTPTAAPANTGAGHGAEVPFVMGTTASCACLGGPAGPGDRAVEQRVGERWFNFAATGKPDGAVAWEQDHKLRTFALEIGNDDLLRPAFMRARLNAFITGLNLAGRRAALP